MIILAILNGVLFGLLSAISGYSMLQWRYWVILLVAAGIYISGLLVGVQQ